MANHLARRSSGHLSKATNGHLAKSCKTTGGACTTSCDVSPDPGYCWRTDPVTHATIRDATPDSMELTITAWAAGKRDWDTIAPYHIFAIDLSALVGVAFCLTWTGSEYYGNFDVTGLAKFLRCYGSGGGPTDCTPTTDITVAARLEIHVGAAGGLPSYDIYFETTDTDWNPPGVERQAVMNTPAGQTSTFTDCCTAYSLSGGTFDPDFGTPPSAYATGETLVPCCTP